MLGSRGARIRARNRAGRHEGVTVAHAKDKGAKDKHVKKKAQHSIKEKRAAKKAKERERSSASRQSLLSSPE